MKSLINQLTRIALFVCAYTLQAETPASIPIEKPDFPNCTVLNQDAQSLKFYDDLIQDQLVAINFVFSCCKTVCPVTQFTFSQLQESLKDQNLQNVRLISVSVDPKRDTPARLKKWSQEFGAGSNWTFITGERATIHQLLKQLQVFTPDINDHPSFIMIGNDRTGIWKRVSSFAGAAVLSQSLATLAESPTASRKM